VYPIGRVKPLVGGPGFLLVGRDRRWRAVGLRLGSAWLVASAGAPRVAAQAPLTQERAGFATWLTTSPTSPRAAVALQPIGSGLSLGPPDADVPLEGVALHRLTVRGGVVHLERGAESRILPRGRPATLGRYTLRADGPPGRAMLTVFRPPARAMPPSYYDPAPDFVFVGPLHPPGQRATVRLLALDGIEVEAAEAGSVLVPLGGRRVRLQVRRIPSPDGDESELQIFFQDRTNGRGSYPAGRFVTLVPVPGGQYRLDFNRARNPFCAYSSAYPCPAPWTGNVVPAAVAAGERYQPS
jgi:hypothetical protein